MLRVRSPTNGAVRMWAPCVSGYPQETRDRAASSAVAPIHAAEATTRESRRNSRANAVEMAERLPGSVVTLHTLAIVTRERRRFHCARATRALASRECDGSLSRWSSPPLPLPGTPQPLARTRATCEPPERSFSRAPMFRDWTATIIRNPCPSVRHPDVRVSGRAASRFGGLRLGVWSVAQGAPESLSGSSSVRARGRDASDLRLPVLARPLFTSNRRPARGPHLCGPGDESRR